MRVQRYAFGGYRITYICRITTKNAENAEKDDFFGCHFCIFLTKFLCISNIFSNFASKIINTNSYAGN